jgi:peptidoglycan/xylan/chitin deacetylase (PgdA/CDA1 family)
MKLYKIGLVLACAPVIALAQSGPKWLTPPAHKQSYLSITFDDATSTQFSAAYPILEAAGLAATLYVNSGPLDDRDSYFMTWGNVRTLHESGWEIGAHTVTHTAIPTLDDIAVVGELVLSRDRIAAEIGEVPSSFASPYGEYDDRTMVHIKNYFQSHVRAWGDNDGLNPLTFDPYTIERVNIDETLTADEICSKVASVKEGKWLVLMFHQVRDLREPDERFVTTAGHLESIAACIKQAQEQQNLMVDTVSAIIQQLNPKKE